MPETYLGQIWHDGKWMDYARGTEEASRAWCRTEILAGRGARVVDWIDKDRVIFSEEDFK